MIIRQEQNHCSEPTARPGSVWPLLLCTAMLAGLPFPASAQSVPYVDMGQVERAVLAEDWERILRLVNDNPSSPVLRAIRGHACLALNNNNESLRLLVSISSEADSRQWQQWATEFADRNSRSAIAHYFKGDALARLQQWQASLAELNEATRLKPECYLAHNASGVVLHALGNARDARTEFAKALSHKKDFADAYASWGTLNVNDSTTRDSARTSTGRSRESSSKDGTKYFKMALAINRDYVLPRNGYGCVYYGQQRYDDAAKCFASVPEESVISGLVAHNSLAVELGRLDETIKQADDAGMSVTAIQMRRNAIENKMRLDVPFAARDKGGRLPGQGRWPPPRPGPKGPKPGTPGTPGNPPQGPDKPPWPGPPIWIPVPGAPWPPDDDTPDMPVPALKADVRRMQNQLSDYLARTGSRSPITTATLPRPGVRRLTAEPNREGGARTNDIASSRTNTGNWLVHNWYGLAYPVVPKSMAESAGY